MTYHMKKLKIIIVFLVCHFMVKSQDTLWVTNFNMKAGTIRLVGGQALISGDTSLTRVFFKWKEAWSSPVDNANVQIDSIRTDLVVWIYQRLLSLPAGYIPAQNFITTFQASISSHRATNSYLDDLCTALETEYSNIVAIIKSKTDAILEQ